MGAPGPPTVSVVVVASRRRQYLGRSVRSALEQSGTAEPFELVVVKDFPDEYVDRLGTEGKLHVVDLEGGTVGEYLATGILSVRGEVVCFLDDDDAFEPSKLARVAAAFAADPSLVYFHNGMNLRHDDGRPARGLFHQKTSADWVIDGQGSPGAAVDHAFSLGLPTNLSCVSVRRSLLLDRLEALRSITGSTDYFCFYAALASGSRLRFASEHLTTYYIHESALRPKEINQDAVRTFDRLSRDQIYVHTWALKLPESTGARRVARSMLTEFQFIAANLHPGTRGELVQTFGRFAASSISLRPRLVLLASPILFAGLFSRRVALSLLFVGRQVVQD